MWRGRSGRRRRIWLGGVQPGHSRLALTCFDAAPGEAVAADADAVAHRLAVAEHEIEPPFAGC